MLYFTPWKQAIVLLIVGLGVLFTIPNFLSENQLRRLPSWLPHRTIVLGLDLQGGSHLLLEVDRNAVIKERVENLRGDVRRTLLDAKIGFTGLTSGERGVQVRLRDPAQADEAKRKLSELAAPVTSVLSGIGRQDVTLDDRGQGLFTLQLTDEGISQRIRSAVDQSIEIVRRRVDELGTTEPSIQRQGEDRLLVQVPGLQDPERLKGILGKTAKLTFRLVDTSMSAEQALATRPPPDDDILYSASEPRTPYLVEKRVMVSGEELTDAQPSFDQRTQEPVVTFRFNTNGARRFATVTQQNVGRPFAIILDNQVISAPVIREPILGGSGQISGSFTGQSANDLAVLLRAGALPAPLNVLEERTVGPGLGADSIAAGKRAAIIGTVAVAVFMLATYGLFGVFANLALLIKIVLIFAAMSLLQATLTLPGIAGIVLTAGMAVDSNVLIYERIREEKRAGKTMIASLDAGFARALATI